MVLFRFLPVMALIAGLVFCVNGKAYGCDRKDIKPMSFDGALEPVNCPRGVACSGKVSRALNVPNVEDTGYSVRRLSVTRVSYCTRQELLKAGERLPRRLRRADRETRKNLQSVIDAQGLTTPLDDLYDEVLGLAGDDSLKLMGLEDGDGNRLLRAEYRWMKPLSDRFVWVWDLDRRNRIIDLQTGDNKPFPRWDEYGFNGQNARFTVGDNQTALYVFPINQREDRYDLVVMGPRGIPETIVPDLRGKWEDFDKVENRSILALENGVILFFGWDGNDEPITYRFKRGEDQSAMPGGLDYVPILNLEANSKSDHGYLLLRPIGLLQTDLGNGSRVYYESYDPNTLKVQTIDDPDYLGVIPILPSKQEQVFGDKDSIYYRQVLFVYRSKDFGGAEQSHSEYEFQIVNGASGPYGDNGKITPNPINIFDAAPDYERLGGVWLPEQPDYSNWALVRQLGTGIWTAGIWPTLRVDVKELVIRLDASGPTRIAANQAATKADIDRREETRRGIEESKRLVVTTQMQDDRRRREEQWARQEEERRRRNAGTSPSAWQSVSPFRSDGTYKKCYYDSDRKYVCY